MLSDFRCQYIVRIMIKFILPIAVFITAVCGTVFPGLVLVQKVKNDSLRLNCHIIAYH